MEQIVYILFGWLLGLLSPAIVDKIKSEYSKNQFFKATCTELHDLQYRVAIVCFMLCQKYGVVDKDFLQWLKPIIENYKGNEPSTSVAALVNAMLEAKDEDFDALVEKMRASKGEGQGLKLFSASFLETNLTLVSNLPMDIQVKIHEFRNHLNTLNQEISAINQMHKLTFDSTISSENHWIISNELRLRYVLIQGMCKRVVDRLGAVVSSTI